MLRTEELRKVQGEVKAARAQVAELQKSIDDLNVSQGGSTSKMKADLTNMVGELSSQITRLHSQIDETQYRLTQLSAKIDKLEQKKIIVGGTAPGATPGTPPVPGAPGTSPAPGTGGDQVRVVEGLDLENLYNQARDDYIRGKYDLALQGFKSVYDKDAGGTWKEQALYWIGESLLKQEKSDKALEAYQRSIKEYPRGNKVCQVRFKIGLIHHQKKDAAKRDDQWGKLISECPGSNEAQRAQEMQKE
jgi:TolA-binding protein